MLLKALDNSLEILGLNRNENGYLVVKCIIARTGIQERYGVEISPEFVQDRLYKEYRSPEEVFKEEVLNAFRNVVITNDHPGELLTIYNTKEHAVGFVSSALEIVEDKYLQCEITIYDEETIEDIEAGKFELSAGYLYALEMVEGEEYDYKQVNIQPNHIAIVQAGRCGSACSIALDAADKSKQGEKMKKVIFKIMLPDGTEKMIVEHEVESEEQAAALQAIADGVFNASVEANKAAAEDMEQMQEDLTTKEGEITAAKEANDRLQAELDTTKKKKVGEDSAAVQTLAQDLAAVMVVANDAGIECQGKTAIDLKKEVIEKIAPDLALDGKSDEYVGYAFDSIAAQIKEAGASYLKGLDLTPKAAADAQATELNEAKDGFQNKYGA